MATRSAFTLVELLIAILFFSCLALVSFRSFSSIKNAGEKAAFALSAAMESMDVIARIRLAEPYSGTKALQPLTGRCVHADCTWSGNLTETETLTAKQIRFIFSNPSGRHYETETTVRVDNDTQT